MANRYRAHDEGTWKNATKICRLNARQLEMAQRLGMNPKKLPRLPGPDEHWKLPVGAFIEDLYRKRFGVDPVDRRPHVARSSSRKPVSPLREVSAREHHVDAMSQAENLVCYLINLAEDLQQWLAQGSIDPEVMRQMRTELQEIVRALDTGASISAMPSIPLPPQPARPAFSRRDDWQVTCDDDDIPF